MLFSLQFLSAVVLDLVVGDPRSAPHPVRVIGWLCTSYERLTRRLCANAKVAGVLSFFLVLITTLVLISAPLILLNLFFPQFEVIIAVGVLYSSIAWRDLYDHSMQVYQALLGSDELDEARTRIAMIVGRDTQALDRRGICRACVETVAENSVDGIASPLFYAIVFSCISTGNMLQPISLAAVGAYAYKAVNTMDSMYGYKNDKYLQFGRFAARVDDYVNWFPARIVALLMVAAAWLLRLNSTEALRILRRDRYAHASPNGGHPEAAVAGILGVQLGGDTWYFGEKISKPEIGESVRDISLDDILQTNRVVAVTSVLFIGMLLLVRFVIMGV